MTIQENTLIKAEVIIDEIPKPSDRLVVRKVIKDYRYCARENKRWSNLFNEIATELECIPEREYIIKAIKELKGASNV